MSSIFIAVSVRPVSQKSHDIFPAGSQALFLDRLKVIECAPASVATTRVPNLRFRLSNPHPHHRTSALALQRRQALVSYSYQFSFIRLGSLQKKRGTSRQIRFRMRGVVVSRCRRPTLVICAILSHLDEAERELDLGALGASSQSPCASSYICIWWLHRRLDHRPRARCEGAK